MSKAKKTVKITKNKERSEAIDYLEAERSDQSGGRLLRRAVPYGPRTKDCSRLRDPRRLVQVGRLRHPGGGRHDAVAIHEAVSFASAKKRPPPDGGGYFFTCYGLC